MSATTCVRGNDTTEQCDTAYGPSAEGLVRLETLIVWIAMKLCVAVRPVTLLMYILLQLRPGMRSCARLTILTSRGSFLVLWAEVDTDAVHAMSLILRVVELFALEDVPQMSSAVVAHNLRPPTVRSLFDGTGEGVPEGGPPAAGIELVVRFVERRIAALAGVDAGFRVVLIEWAGTGVFGALLAEDSELLCAMLASCARGGMGEGIATRGQLCLPLALWLLHWVVGVVRHTAGRSEKRTQEGDVWHRSVYDCALRGAVDCAAERAGRTSSDESARRV
jgi:hypothetical protein